MGSRNWCFTLNNPLDNEISLDPVWLKLLIANKELGAQDTPHYQGYLECTHSVRMQQLKNWLPRAHFEIRRGTQAQAVKYCIKDYLIEDVPNPIYRHDTLNELQSYGLLVNTYFNRDWTLEQLLESLDTVPTDKLKSLMEKVRQGATELELAELDPSTWARNYKALERYKRLITKPRYHEMTVIVMYGPTGTGKSKLCYDKYTNAYWKQRSSWWDGYENQETVILDEFYGWLPFDTLLRICDRYPLLVETKGGQKQFTSKTIVIVSNNAPNSWYKNINIDPLKRRITQYIYMPRLGEILYASTYDDFLNLSLPRPIFNLPQ